jgi:hypothetical protein
MELEREMWVVRGIVRGVGLVAGIVREEERRTRSALGVLSLTRLGKKLGLLVYCFSPYFAGYLNN